MEFYILIGIVVLLILVILILIFKKDNKKTNDVNFELLLRDEYNKLKIDLLQITNNTNKDNKTDLVVLQNELFKRIDENFNNVTNRVNNKLGDSFKKSDETFIGVTERLVKLDEQHKYIEKLSSEVLQLNNLLTDKSSRGAFGEVVLEQVIYSVFPDNSKLVEKQKTLSNGRRVDIILHAPMPLGSICIDSKFPLENYRASIDDSLTSEFRDKARKEFIKNVKQHIIDIKNKYIIEDETSDQAMLFVPSEAIFLDIVNKHYELIEYANSNKVWIVSPTTLLSTLSTILIVLKNIEQNNKTSEIIKELKLLSTEFTRYYDRFEELDKLSNRLTDSIKDIKITSDKISKRFDNIEKGNFDE